MNLKCKINGKDYDIAQGCNFSEEYNETLDSGTIVIPHVKKIKDLRPYDDVYIWNSNEEFKGYNNGQNIQGSLKINCYVKQEKEYSYGDNDELEDIRYINYIRIDKSIFGILSDFSSNIVVNNVIVDYFFNHFSYSDNVNVSFEKQDEKILMKVYYENKTLRNTLEGTYTDNYIEFVTSCWESDTNYKGVANITIPQIYAPYNISCEQLEMPSFYKHLLVDSFQEEIINIGKENTIYNYKIELFSETKKLERIILPNISITQPLKASQKKSIYKYMVDFVEMYSPVKKVSIDEENNIWDFQKKYTIDPNLESEWSNTYAPDFTLNSPTLRELLSRLMVVKDCIPYVEDDVIKALDITKRNGEFDAYSEQISGVVASRSSENHCDNLRRNYSEALSNFKSTKRVEYLGFRNSDTSLMTLSNMRVETEFPIYKINKMYMCYYKNVNVENTKKGTKRVATFLCKQDITKLVKLESERNALSQDWEEMGDFNNVKTIDDVAKYKLCTVGYNIGSNYITGWGTQYTYPKGWWDINSTYIDNIITITNWLNPYGIYQYGYVTKLLKDFNPNEEIMEPVSSSSLKGLEVGKWDEAIEHINGWNGGAIYKGLFFEIDYQAFYSGSLIHSKDDARDDITMNDNSSSSLTLLESDGIAQKEKVNRFANKTYNFNARYNNINQLQPLGSYWVEKDEDIKNYVDDDDVIIYSRNYTIWDNEILAKYTASKKYVLKNYFTNVFARHRTYNLMPYGESVSRAEVKKTFILMSKNKSLIEQNNNQISFENFNNGSALEKILSFFKTTIGRKTIDYRTYNDKANYGLIVVGDKAYATDVNCFNSGISLCFNLRNKDNITSGVYIEKPVPDLDNSVWNDLKKGYNWEKIWKYITFSDVKGDYTGSLQNFYQLTNDFGFIDKAKFIVGHNNDVENEVYKGGEVFEKNQDTIENIYYNRLFKLPYVDGVSLTNAIGGEYKINKDNKESLDMTFQIEPYNVDDSIVFSEWLARLSDVLDIYEKNEKNINITDYQYSKNYVMFYSSTMVDGPRVCPTVVLEMPKAMFNATKSGDTFTGANFVWDQDVVPGSESETLIKYVLQIKDIQTISENIICVGTSYSGIMLKGTFKKKNISLPSKEGKMYLYKFKEDDYGYYYINLREHFIGPQSTGEYYLGNENFIKFLYDGSEMEFQDVDIDCGNGKIFYANPLDEGLKLENLNITSENFNSSKVIISNQSRSGITKTYLKNMYLMESNQEAKSTKIYDEYNSLSQLQDGIEATQSSKTVNDTFSIKVDENGMEYLYADLTNVSRNTKSLQYWYLDQDNLDDYKVQKNVEFSEWYYKFNENSGLSFWNTYEHKFPMDSQTVSVEYISIHDAYPEENNNHLLATINTYNVLDNIVSFNFSDATKDGQKVTIEGDKRYVIFVWRTILNNPQTPTGNFKFVFGVNLTEEDFEKNYVKIYLSVISTKDERVYDKNNNLIGCIRNFALPYNQSSASSGLQLYDKYI